MARAKAVDKKVDAHVIVAPLQLPRRTTMLLKGWLARRDAMLARVAEIEVTSPELYAEGALALDALTKLVQEITAAHKEAKAPYKDEVDTLDVAKREMVQPIEQEKLVVSNKLTDYKTREREEQARELERRAEQDRKAALLAKHPVAASPVQPTLPAVASQPGSEKVHQRVDTTWRVVDFAALPDEFKMENKVKLNAAIIRGKRTDIPGVKISTKEKTVSSGR